MSLAFASFRLRCEHEQKASLQMFLHFIIFPEALLEQKSLSFMGESEASFMVWYQSLKRRDNCFCFTLPHCVSEELQFALCDKSLTTGESFTKQDAHGTHRTAQGLDAEDAKIETEHLATVVCLPPGIFWTRAKLESLHKVRRGSCDAFACDRNSNDEITRVKLILRHAANTSKKGQLLWNALRVRSVNLQLRSRRPRQTLPISRTIVHSEMILILFNITIPRRS